MSEGTRSTAKDGIAAASSMGDDGGAQGPHRSSSNDTKDNQGPTTTTATRARRSSASSASSSSSITSLFESSLSLLGSLPVATSRSASSNKPVLHQSIKHGQFKLYLSDMDTFEDIQLQSHLLWPSSPKLAQLMEENQLVKGIKGERGVAASVIIFRQL